jgi:murein DD-endopeptidase MepM/ murein hydrolase activator NlpD
MRRTLIACVCVAAAIVAATPSPAFAAKTAAAIAKELAAVRAKVKSAGNQYDKALAALENTDDRIKATDKRMKSETKDLAGAETMLGDRAAAMYRSGDDMGMLTFMLGATTFDDFITRADLIQLIGDRDAALVSKIKDTRARLERNRRALEKDRSSQAADLTVFKKRRNALQTELQKVQAQYARLLGELAAAMEREKAAGHVTYMPKGPNGMVFPVRGANYYSNTWGAARSGGRRHKGTDLMAPRGTPCVAISSGSVRVRSGGLGGKTITLSGDNGWTYYYAHLNGYAVTGGRVSAGQLIGYVGSTGNARGGSPHLHLQMGPSGRWVNPYPYLVQMQ